eukprot:m.248768 g.248768  ORF g.248768 m.248768 type:complete len:159 (-) comp26475_c4_seq1:431-907(-)
MGKSKKNFYAVAKGNGGPQIYRTWPECQSKVSGFPGAVFKGFATEKEAQAFIQASGGGGGGRAGGTESAPIGGADPAQQAQQPDSGADWTNEESPRLPSAHEVEASPWHTQGTPSTDGTSAAWKDNVLVDTFPVDSDGGDSGGDGDGGGDGGCGGCGD